MLLTQNLYILAMHISKHPALAKPKGVTVKSDHVLGNGQISLSKKSCTLINSYSLRPIGKHLVQHYIIHIYKINVTLSVCSINGSMGDCMGDFFEWEIASFNEL